MKIQRRFSDAAIRSVVRSFAERSATLAERVVAAPLPARPDQFMEFYLQDRYAVSRDGGPPTLAPQTVIVGPQGYRRTRLLMSGDIHVFTIGFQPGGFHALFGASMNELVDQGVEASDVIGPAASALRDLITMASDFDARVVAAQRWIGMRMQITKPIDEVGRLAAVLQRSGGRLRIDALARRAMLSDRQFARRFETQVGLTPKLFARMVRFNAVLSAKADAPRTSWTELIHHAGYADQSHFVRDCQALAGSAPREFFFKWVQGR